MTGRVWSSNITGGGRIGDKQGIRDKYFGEDWEPAQFIATPSKPATFAAMLRHAEGYALERFDFPEASAVWNWGCFKRLRDLFVVGCFYAVKGRLAEALAAVDLGEGGLIPYTIYKEDLTTPIDGQFYILNLGARKDTFLSDYSKNVEFLGRNKETGKELWSARTLENGNIALSADALAGPDLWVEARIRSTLFMSEKLIGELRAKRVRMKLELAECRVMDARCARQ